MILFAGMILGWVALGLTASGGAGMAAQPTWAAELQPAASHQTVLDTYCVICHNDVLLTGGLSLTGLDLERVGEGAEVWEKVARKLRSRTMPPPGIARPDSATYDSLAQYLEKALDRAAAQSPNPGRNAIQRLNRAEYTNAIRDLLGVRIDGAELLPADDSRYGFDNVGDVLTVSPLLLERYLGAARKISRLAVGMREAKPAFETYEVSPYLKQNDRVSEELPFGTRGGISLRHYFPLDGEYLLRVRLQRNSRDFIRGLGEAHQLDVRLDGVLLKLFSIGGEKKGRSAGIFSTGSMGDPAQEEYERTADEALELRFRARAGNRRLGVAFLKQTMLPEGPLRSPMTQFDFAQYKGGEPAVARVILGGPFRAEGLSETESRRRIFVCHPDRGDKEGACAEKILSRLGRLAYRRPLRDDDLHTLLNFYEIGRSEGGFEAGIGLALERILVGPEFLFRMEPDPPDVAPNAAYLISDLQLASRLSFFLWSSIPDDQLLKVAEAGDLRTPETLQRQVLRMLADPRSEALVNNFAGQWLHLRNLSVVQPDPEVFPYFDDNLREAFRRETELLFESLLKEDRSILDFFRADYTYLNERLARHYQIPNVYGSHFRRVKLSDVNRSGLLGHGSILTVTSYANRTSPVLRGKWLLDNILGAPPPPPPPNIPELRDRDETGRVLSMREQMEQHRSNPVCASCHNAMDPLGFALENFDGIGHWRTADAGSPIDSSGVLPDGTEFTGPDGLRKVMLGKSQEFVSVVTEKLLTYAVGRGVEYYDAPAARKIVRESQQDDYRWSSLVLGVVNSVPFQMRRSHQP